MKSKRNTKFICNNCGLVTVRWVGQCSGCSAWNTISEERESESHNTPGLVAAGGKILSMSHLGSSQQEVVRVVTGINELDRVTGGGFVHGSAILLGGDPGIGKSTLLTQTAGRLSKSGSPVVYVTGEEAVDQVRIRARRLGLGDSQVLLAAETNVDDILATISTMPPLSLVIVDSIQTLWTGSVDSAPGTVTQVRISTQLFIRWAKTYNTAVILVGHVTKDGQIAGPRVVEHMVDAVLYFEGDGARAFRLLRSVKNRFGPTDEIGVFEMTSYGLAEVNSPSELLLGEMGCNAPGAAVHACMEGSRPLLVEIQALVVPTALGTPRRAVVGWDAQRLAMILAVLEARCGLRLSGHDVYLNVAGGLRIQDPAADLAVAAALVSAFMGVALGDKRVYCGEISLSGAVRPVSWADQRLREAERLGFKGCVAPKGSAKAPHPGFTVNEISTINELVSNINQDRMC